MEGRFSYEELLQSLQLHQCKLHNNKKSATRNHHQWAKKVWGLDLGKQGCCFCVGIPYHSTPVPEWLRAQGNNQKQILLESRNKTAFPAAINQKMSLYRNAGYIFFLAMTSFPNPQHTVCTQTIAFCKDLLNNKKNYCTQRKTWLGTK